MGKHHTRWVNKLRLERPERYREFLDSKNRQNRARRLRRYEGYKQGPCTDCGQTFDPVCMDFDHVRGEKVENVATLINGGASKEAIMEEIAKCELVCANCHRLRTKNRWKT